jgi:LPS export ABC transporter permease LptG
MNKIILHYLLKGFIKNFLIVVGVFYCFGLILNLFEEVEFFKNLDVSILTPLMLTSIYIPSLIIKVLPFVIFISCIWFILELKHSKDLLTIKVFGYSNIKIFFILAICAFLIGWIILFLVNPITSNMAKYYEKVKANYSRDVDHLINFKRDGLWIKEKLENKQRFIYAKKIENDYLNNITIIHLDDKSNFLEKLIAEKAYIKENEWTLYNVNIIKLKEGVTSKTFNEQYNIVSIYNLSKINNLFKNFDTMLFVDLMFNFEKLLDVGYGKKFLDQSLHSLLTLPFFLFLMTSIASVLALSNLNKRNNVWTTVVIGIIVVIIVFYLKDFSLALGQIDKIPLTLSIWAPIIALCLFTFIGVIQINEK